MEYLIAALLLVTPLVCGQPNSRIYHICQDNVIDPSLSQFSIISPGTGTPQGYPNNVRCSLHYGHSSVPKVLRVKFVAFDVQPDENCNKDSFNINSAKLCGTWPQGETMDYLVNPNEAFVFSFTSDSMITRKGFVLNVQVQAYHGQRLYVYTGQGDQLTNSFVEKRCSCTGMGGHCNCSTQLTDDSEDADYFMNSYKTGGLQMSPMYQNYNKNYGRAMPVPGYGYSKQNYFGLAPQNPNMPPPMVNQQRGIQNQFYRTSNIVPTYKRFSSTPGRTNPYNTPQNTNMNLVSRGYASAPPKMAASTQSRLYSKYYTPKASSLAYNKMAQQAANTMMMMKMMKGLGGEGGGMGGGMGGGETEAEGPFGGMIDSMKNMFKGSSGGMFGMQATTAAPEEDDGQLKVEKPKISFGNTLARMFMPSQRQTNSRSYQQKGYQTGPMPQYGRNTQASQYSRFSQTSQNNNQRSRSFNNQMFNKMFQMTTPSGGDDK